MKEYNTTELNVISDLDRNWYHRDRLAHYFRWAFVGHLIKLEDTIIDFGCGKGELAQVLYTNQFKPKRYIGYDIRKIKPITTTHNPDKLIEWCEVIQKDLVLETDDYIKGDKVVSFEVLEHIGKQNVDAFLQNFKSCGKDDATYYLSTPCFDGNCASNHYYNDQCNELTREETKEALERNGFTIQKCFGTFSSQKDMLKHLTPEHRAVFDQLNEYYYSHVISIMFAPLYPEHSRNNIWVLNKKERKL